MRTKVTTYYLEMTARKALRRPERVPDDLEFKRAEIPSPDLNHLFYRAVGGEWFWVDRLEWSYDEWLKYLDRAEVETWVLYHHGTPAGYCELELRDGGEVEIAYLGLLPMFVGRGAGAYLLSAAIERAWEIGGERVWLHTCSLDHPRALNVYKRAGFRVYKEEESFEEMPETAPSVWKNEK